MMERIRKNTKSKKQLQAEMEVRFSYLSDAERYKLIYGDVFVKVPSEELKRLKINVYPYLMWWNFRIIRTDLCNALIFSHEMR